MFYRRSDTSNAVSRNTAVSQSLFVIANEEMHEHVCLVRMEWLFGLGWSQYGDLPLSPPLFTRTQRSKGLCCQALERHAHLLKIRDLYPDSLWCSLRIGCHLNGDGIQSGPPCEPQEVFLTLIKSFRHRLTVFLLACLLPPSIRI